MNDKTHSPDTLTGHKEGFYEAGQQAAKAHMKRFADKTHSPEPWIFGTGIHPSQADFNGYCEIRDALNSEVLVEDRDREQVRTDLKRIVACVNACAPFTDPEKEIPALQQRIAELEEEVADREQVQQETLQREAALEKENNFLRPLALKFTGKCLHCGLNEISKCSRGFPGCAAADDILIGEQDAAKRQIERVQSLTAERDELKAILRNENNTLHLHCLRNLTREQIDHLLGEEQQKLRAELSTLRADVERLKGVLQGIIDSCVNPATAHRAVMVDLAPVRKALENPQPHQP